MHSHVWRQTVGPCTFSNTNAELNETKRGRVGIYEEGSEEGNIWLHCF